ncbi:helix-turn-helix domain-containing protein [Micromonospora craterilacus]|uniref:helix-turn-helix domain-containing protein n=1 Tax=Micromonospora craterilacus TaxID=1655439 RepID=UPI0013140A53|nr:helix-turn-helix domain-containing protein [Micromonospora craterilacus]
MANHANRSPSLGELVRQRRENLRLTIDAAATAAGISRGTWINLEGDARQTHPHNYAGIEHALMWAPGSIRAIRNGGSPTPLDAGIHDELAHVERVVRSISTNPNRSERLRGRADSILEQIRSLREAEQREARERGA